jgi:hypothetical protein
MPAACAVHPQASAIDTCSRCGAYVCEACLELYGEQPFCAACAAKVLRPGVSTRSAVALGLGVLGLGFPPLGLLALWLARRELRDIAEGKAPVPSRPFAKAAGALGVVAVVLCALAVVAVAGLLWLHGDVR